MTERIELPADLKTQIQDEVSIQQCRFDEQTHQGIDAAIRVFARLVESWRPVPAEAGDSTANPRVWRDDIGSYWDEEPNGRVRLRVPNHSTTELVLPLDEATEAYDLAELRPASSVRDTAEAPAASEIFTYNSPEPTATVLRDLDSGRYVHRSGDRWADGTSQGPSGLPSEPWNVISRGRSFKVVHPAPSGDTAETTRCSAISERWGHLPCENDTDGHPGLCVAWHAESGKPKHWDRKSDAPTKPASELAAADELSRLTEEMDLYDRPAVTADETPGSPA